MPATPLSRRPEPDEQALDKALRDAKLRTLALQTRRVLADSRRLVAEHQAACRRMMETIHEARARLPDAWRAQSAPTGLAPREQETAGSVTMAAPTFHKSASSGLSSPAPVRGEP